MWIWVGGLCFISGVVSCLNMTLLEKKRHIFMVCLLLMALGVLLVPLSSHWGIPRLRGFLGDISVLSLVCIWQIIEAVIVLVSGLALIRGHYKERVPVWSQWLSLSPSLLFIGGIFIAQVVVFSLVGGRSLFQLGLGVSVLITAGVFLFSRLILRAIVFWEDRVELKMMLSFLQIVLAMFIPVLLQGQDGVSASQFSIEVNKILIVWACLGAAVLAGILAPEKIKRKIGVL